MSEVRDPSTDQQPPQPGRELVHQAILDELGQYNLDDAEIYAIGQGVKARLALGIRKYGTPLQSHNGRDAAQDAWEEAIDLLAYLYQMHMEGEPSAGDLAASVVNVLAGLARYKIDRGDAEVR
jgi:hypothetical protein